MKIQILKMILMIVINKMILIFLNMNNLNKKINHQLI